MLRITYIVFFGKQHLPHHSKHHFPLLSKSHLLPFTQLSILYQLFYHIFNPIISILQYCYHIVTILISITYSYIYRYNLSIKIYNNQYRYKHTDIIIRIIPKNTEINKYTVYT